MSETFIKSSPGFQFKKFDVSKGQLTAVITSFKNYDVVNDVMKPGSLDEYLKNFNGGLPMLFQHTRNDIVGKWNKIYIDGDLVIGEGEIFPEVSKGSDSMALITRGMIGATSIGFRSSDFDKNDKGGLDFNKIELTEVSLVAEPANPKAQILSAKTKEGKVDIRKVEKLLRDAGLSNKESKAFIANGKDGLRDVVDFEVQKQDLTLKLINLLKQEESK